MKISAVILTKNSADSIEKTLSSVSFCDEILVIDDGSSDDTGLIAVKHHAVFIKHDLGNDFASQRNFGLSKAQGDWVFFVDSDEVVSKELKEEIRNTISKSGECVGFYVKRQDVLWGKELNYGETSCVRLLRLGKKGAGVWERPVHEVWKIEGETDNLNSPLMHYPHQTVGEFLSDINRYSSINARTFYHEGVRVRSPDIIAYPLGKFIQNYFFRLGFLDGMPGLVLALMMSFHSFLTRGKLWELQKKNQK